MLEKLAIKNLLKSALASFAVVTGTFVGTLGFDIMQNLLSNTPFIANIASVATVPVGMIVIAVGGRSLGKMSIQASKREIENEQLKEQVTQLQEQIQTKEITIDREQSKTPIHEIDKEKHSTKQENKKELTEKWVKWLNENYELYALMPQDIQKKAIKSVASTMDKENLLALKAVVREYHGDIVIKNIMTEINITLRNFQVR